MLVLTFEGWFQCRLATNPDPTDEPRGVSGFTFAVADEPDFDRIIRLEEPVAHRSHAPSIGVCVTSVVRDGESQEIHPALGGRVNLLHDPRFESRNLLLSDDKAGTGLIDPFHLRIEADGIRIERADVLYPPDPELPICDVPADALNRRAPLSLTGMTLDPLRIAEATGIVSPGSHRKVRRRRLEADLESTGDSIESAGLRRRIEDLKITDPQDMRLISMSLCQTRRFEINGPVVIDDDAGVLELDPDPSLEWPIEFWMGAWDADGLCGYMKGTVSIPQAPETRHSADGGEVEG